MIRVRIGTLKGRRRIGGWEKRELQVEKRLMLAHGDAVDGFHWPRSTASSLCSMMCVASRR